MSKRDSDPITICGKNDDLLSMFVDIASEIQYKLLLMVFLLFIVLNTDVFINRVLGKLSNTIDGHRVTSWGVILQGTFLVLGMIAMDALVKNNII
jgi:hypothetical protein